MLRHQLNVASGNGNAVPRIIRGNSSETSTHDTRDEAIENRDSVTGLQNARNDLDAGGQNDEIFRTLSMSSIDMRIMLLGDHQQLRSFLPDLRHLPTMLQPVENLKMDIRKPCLKKSPPQHGIGLPETFMEFIAMKTPFDGMRRYVFNGTPVIIFNCARYPTEELFNLKYLKYFGKSKIWITGAFDFSGGLYDVRSDFSHADARDLISNICDRLFRCDARYFNLWCKLPIDFNKLRVLVQKAKIVFLDVSVNHQNGIRARLEEVVGFFPNVEHLVVETAGRLISDEDTMDAMLNLKNLCRLQSLELYGMSRRINFDKLLAFLVKHRVGKARTVIEFDDSDDEFDSQFDQKLQILQNEISKVPRLQSMLRSTDDASGNGKTAPRVVWKTPAAKQRFSLPEPLIRYLALHPNSPEEYLKLASTCKYFFEVNPVLIVKKMFNYKKHHDMLKNAGNSKIWITDEITIEDVLVTDVEVSSYLSLLARRLFRCDAHTCYIWGNAAIDFDTIQLFTKMAKLVVIDAPVVHANGRRVRLEEIFTAAPAAKEFRMYCSNMLIADEKSMDALYELESLGTSDTLSLWDIPQTVNLDKFFDILKKYRFGKLSTFIKFGGAFTDAFASGVELLHDKIIKVPGSRVYIYPPVKNF